MKTFDQILAEMQIDAMYGKNKHFNAANRKEKLYYRIKIPLIILSILAGGSFFFPILKGSSFAAYLPSIITSGISIIGNILAFLKLPEEIKGHRNVANRYLDTMKKCNRLRSYLFEDAIVKDQIDRRIEDIAIEISQINKDAEAYSTNDDDFKKAKINVDEGNETYTELEKKL